MAFSKIEHYEKEYLDQHHDSALNVTEGVEEKPVVNPYFVRKKRRQMTTDEYVAGILEGNITILAQAITLIESNNPTHYAQAQEIIEKCLPHSGRSVRIGITGVPGAGKTLVGLDVAIKQTYQGNDKPVEDEGAVYLSGNGPLVAVLNEALAQDNSRGGDLLPHSLHQILDHPSRL